MIECWSFIMVCCLGGFVTVFFFTSSISLFLLHFKNNASMGLLIIYILFLHKYLTCQIRKKKETEEWRIKKKIGTKRCFNTVHTVVCFPLSLSFIHRSRYIIKDSFSAPLSLVATVCLTAPNLLIYKIVRVACSVCCCFSLLSFLFVCCVFFFLSKKMFHFCCFIFRCIGCTGHWCSFFFSPLFSKLKAIIRRLFCVVCYNSNGLYMCVCVSWLLVLR